MPLKVIEESTVGPDLGKDSIHAGIIASAIAAIAVVVFMALTYGRFGLYADLAVVINIFVILGVLALLNGTLTLPGIAGFVLTIGTAVDANVLINERIREERRRGRSVVQSVELGYKEASRTIFEANVTHAISGVIMFLLGSGPVKGFAVVLLIGICDQRVHRGDVHPDAGGTVDPPQQAQGRCRYDGSDIMRLLKIVPDNTNIGFVRLRHLAFGLTMLLTVTAIALVGLARSLNFGVDFVGGLMIEEKFAGAPIAGPRAPDRRRTGRRRGLAPAVRRPEDRVDPPARAAGRGRGRDQRRGQEGRDHAGRQIPRRDLFTLLDRVGQGLGGADPQRRAGGVPGGVRHRACGACSVSNGSSAYRPLSRSCTTC